MEAVMQRVFSMWLLLLSSIIVGIVGVTTLYLNDSSAFVVLALLLFGCAGSFAVLATNKYHLDEDDL